MTEPIWKPVPGYEGLYEVSSSGEVRSLPRTDSRGRRVSGGFLSIRTHPSGHKQVKLSRDGSSVTAKLHQVVLTAFAGPRPEGCEVLHNDGNPANNAAANLRWGTRSENLRDSVRHGTHFWASKTACPQNHAYDNENTHVTSDGRRMCRTCLREKNHIRRQKINVTNIVNNFTAATQGLPMTERRATIEEISF